ncbi:MAG: YdcF family protein, partial [Pseudomonadota bacterium]
MGVIRRLAYRLAQLFVVVFAITLAAVWVAERQALETYRLDRLEPVDVLIVLGGGVDPDRRLNWVGRTRANTAATALAAERAGAVIFSGTLNSEEHPEGEAGLMRNHALNRGVDPSKLFVETDSRTTLENLRFSFSLADAQGHERIAILTDAFHLPRALA